MRALSRLQVCLVLANNEFRTSLQPNDKFKKKIRTLSVNKGVSNMLILKLCFTYSWALTNQNVLCCDVVMEYSMIL